MAFLRAKKIRYRGIIGSPSQSSLRKINLRRHASYGIVLSDERFLQRSADTWLKK